MTTLRESLTYEPVELAFGTSGLRALVTDMTDLECFINTTGFLNFLQKVDNLPPKSTIYIAGDLRYSTPRVLQAIHLAVTDAGHKTIYCGLIPTPAVAYYALGKGAPCIMVTGSHIPEDRNGIKFYKTHGEVLKEDELAIKESVAEARQRLYNGDAAISLFRPDGQLAKPPRLPDIDLSAIKFYQQRYVDVFAGKLKGKKVVFYQHSSVGRESLVDLLENLGAEVVAVNPSNKFVPIDTENVTPDDQAYFKILARDNPDVFAIVSTDGDADRPFVIDETGTFHRGDVLGAIVADWLNADFAAYPVSASDAVDSHLGSNDVSWEHTKIGSPYVVIAMLEALRAGHTRTVGWEVNGGFMIGNDFPVGGGVLKALPTRDAILPIIVAMLTAIEAKQPISAIFAKLPQRATQAGLINDFPNDVYTKIHKRFATDSPKTRQELGHYFTAERGFGDITAIDNLDGIRIHFSSGDIAHLRQSGNAPQLRIYGIADSQERADEIVSLAIAEPDGIFRQLQHDINAVK
jgi:phosphomannomutase